MPSITSLWELSDTLSVVVDLCINVPDFISLRDPSTGRSKQSPAMHQYQAMYSPVACRALCGHG